ncbi:hypothetical protein SUGI_1177820 [Cryptomeria japonica]|nr:hypothetical protein SUGI_1177820 [Cryptomeria japonica]
MVSGSGRRSKSGARASGGHYVAGEVSGDEGDGEDEDDGWRSYVCSGWVSMGLSFPSSLANVGFVWFFFVRVVRIGSLVYASGKDGLFVGVAGSVWALLVFVAVIRGFWPGVSVFDGAEVGAVVVGFLSFGVVVGSLGP